MQRLNASRYREGLGEGFEEAFLKTAAKAGVLGKLKGLGGKLGGSWPSLLMGGLMVPGILSGDTSLGEVAGMFAAPALARKATKGYGLSKYRRKVPKNKTLQQRFADPKLRPDLLRNAATRTGEFGADWLAMDVGMGLGNKALPMRLGGGKGNMGLDAGTPPPQRPIQGPPPVSRYPYAMHRTMQYPSRYGY